jgi:hypothetical protein
MRPLTALWMMKITQFHFLLIPSHPIKDYRAALKCGYHSTTCTNQVGITVLPVHISHSITSHLILLHHPDFQWHVSVRLLPEGCIQWKRVKNNISIVPRSLVLRTRRVTLFPIAIARSTAVQGYPVLPCICQSLCAEITNVSTSPAVHILCHWWLYLGGEHHFISFVQVFWWTFTNQGFEKKQEKFRVLQQQRIEVN